jgi:septin family protein
MKVVPDSKNSSSSNNTNNNNAPPPHSSACSPVDSVEWTEADTVGSAVSMLDLAGLGTILLRQQQQQEPAQQEPEEEEEEDEHKQADGGRRPATISSSAVAVHIEVGAPVVKRYNFMVVGVNGSGKSTFCARLLQRYFPHFSLVVTEDPSSSSSPPDFDGTPTTMISERARCERMQGNNTRIIFTIVDSPGYGDTIDNQTDRFWPIEQYIRQQNELYETMQVYRRPNDQGNDSRIHCCFYFLMPHRVTPLDGGFMQKLQTMVPLVPIIAKADTYTTQEIAAQLSNLERCLAEYQITIFDFRESQQGMIGPDRNNKDYHHIEDHHFDQHYGTTTTDECTTTTTTSHGPTICPPAGSTISVPTVSVQRPQIPNVFAVISGHRQYMWGIAREDDPRHSDTPRLHAVLFQSRRLHSLSRLQECANDMHELWLQEQQQQRRTIEKQRDMTEQVQKKRTAQQVLHWQICLALMFLLGCFFFPLLSHRWSPVIPAK